MKTIATLFFCAIASISVAQNPSLSGFPSSIPAASLKDPLGNIHTSTGKLAQPVVVIFSVPSMAQGGNQKGWANALGADPKTKLPKSVGFYLVENMSQAGFGSVARDEMKKKYRLGDRPVLLLDEDGSESKTFGIPRNSTCVLVYNRSNKLVWAEKGPATEAAVARVRQKVAAMLN